MTAEQPLVFPVVTRCANDASPGPLVGFAERVALAASPDNDGETFSRSDYLMIAMASIVVPACLYLLAWALA